jgi:CRP-like cAMP-binding protein
MKSGPLIAHIRQYISLNNEEALLLEESLELLELKKKAFLLREGEVCTANYFVMKGLLRSWFTTDRDAEQVCQFAIENWWITDYQSLELRQPSLFNIQAVESTTVACIRRDRQDALFAAIPQLERYFRIILEKALNAANLRIKYIFSLSGQERYDHFAGNFPEFMQRVPQYMLASYLGFTPEFLSKIRAKRIS